jgi:hypothetical protein
MSKKIRRIRKTVAEELEADKREKEKKQALQKVNHRKQSEVLYAPPRKAQADEKRSETKSRWRAEEELLRACISEGMTRTNMKQVMSMNERELAEVERRLLANEGQPFINQSTAHRYFTYALQQEQSLRDLEFLLDNIMQEVQLWHEAYEAKVKSKVTDEDLDDESSKLPPKPSMQAAIMAIKAKSDIFERTIKMGQDLGLIEKRAKEMRVSGNLNLAALPTEELRTVLNKKLKEFEKLVDEGSLPTVYKKMIQGKAKPHAEARSRGRDGTNLDPTFIANKTRSLEGNND